MSFSFPQNFRFGVADADLQVIGEANTRKFDHSEETMWHYFAQNSGKCFQNQTPDEGIDRYHLWQEDIGIMQRMNVTNYRTSVSMSRLLKHNGDVNKSALEWYTNYFKTLRQANISIYATLYHWELPQFLSQQGGWKNQQTLTYFTKHAEVVAKYLGEYITEYFIFNEARHVAFRSYFEGLHAPGETSLKGALLASHTIHLAHAHAFKAVKSQDKNAQIGTVVTLSPSYAASEKAEDVTAAYTADGLRNRWFLEPFFLGKYPEDILELYKKDLPQISLSDMKAIHIGSKLSSIGINYYKGAIIKHDPTHPLGFVEIVKEKSVRNDLGWPLFYPPLYPQGLYDILCQVYFSYKKFGLPKLYITENGIALKNRISKKTNKIDDSKRIKYIAEHLNQVHKAILRGVPVEAYFAWTFMDNYEWPDGYRPEAAFGLIHVDRKTMKRTWKESAYWYKKLIKTHTLPEE